MSPDPSSVFCACTCTTLLTVGPDYPDLLLVHIHLLTSPLASMSGFRDGGKSLIPSK